MTKPSTTRLDIYLGPEIKQKVDVAEIKQTVDVAELTKQVAKLRADIALLKSQYQGRQWHNCNTSDNPKI
jgi:hypothetical protein